MTEQDLALKDAVLKLEPEIMEALLQKINQAEDAEAQLECHRKTIANYEEVLKHKDKTLFELETENKMLNGMVAFTKELAMGLVRNTEYRSSVLGSSSGKTIAIPGGPTNSGYAHNCPPEHYSSTSTTEPR
jgi:predicted RNase H-like nuclease (RuvC/YqgF family)